MNNYIEIIKNAILFFPLIAFITSVPFILIEYHKYGSIHYFKTIIIYSFFLYLICAYFLIILPLPTHEYVASLTTPKTQLIPFKFIYDFFSNINIFKINKITDILFSTYFYVPLYNLFLTLPFGIYLRYYFKCNLKKTILYSFLLSLFFELTQLTGLYFIYERSYRLFDVDDLILNTIGGILGYFFASLFIKILPKREKIDESAKKHGKNVSGFKRCTSLILDMFIYFIITFCLSKVICYKYLHHIVFIVYYIIIPVLLKGSSLSQKFINLKVVNYNNQFSRISLIIRISVFLIIYVIAPSFLIKISSNHLDVFITIILICLMFLFYIIVFIKYLFTNKEMFYEKISKTKLISTIK